MSIRNPITVDEVIEWSSGEDIDLGSNPKRTLIRLASLGIIPKTIKGPSCKGIYEKSVIQNKLRFYNNRKKENWKVREIKHVMDKIDAVDEHKALSYEILEEFEKASTDHIIRMPLEDSFIDVFKEFQKKNPSAAHSIIQFFENQESLTGTPIGKAFRKLIGRSSEKNIWENQISMNFTKNKKSTQ